MECVPIDDMTLYRVRCLIGIEKLTELLEKYPPIPIPKYETSKSHYISQTTMVAKTICPE